MNIHRLPANEDTVRRHVEELWVPYHRGLEAIIEGHALADDVDLVEEEVEFRLDRLEAEGCRTWIAVDELHSGGSRDEIVLARIDGGFAGFIATEIDHRASSTARIGYASVTCTSPNPIVVRSSLGI